MSLLKIAAAALVLWLPGVGGLPPQPSSNCQRKCGNVYIDYPFGLGQYDVDYNDKSPDHCARRAEFYLECRNNVPIFQNVPFLNISLQHGEALVMNTISSYCYSEPNGSTSMEILPPPLPGGIQKEPGDSEGGMEHNQWSLDLTGWPYRFSDTRNKFTVIGCRTLAYIRDKEDDGKYMSGCVSVCKRGNVSTATDGTCSGIGCCQTAIPTDLQYYEVSFDSRMNTTEIYDETPCSYAVLMDSSSFNFSTSYLTSSTGFNNSYQRPGQAPLVLDWAIRDASSCEDAKKNLDSYACVSSNSVCSNSQNGPGYLCNCAEGYEGNPYLQGQDGCKDINECKDNPCYGVCKNKPGGFDCVCHPGFQGNASVQGGCQKEPVGTLPLSARLAIGAVACVIVGLIGFLGWEVIQHKRSIKKQALLRQRDGYFQQHGGQLLLEMMKVEGNVAFTIYERGQIETATNNFNKENIIGEGGQGTVYKAVLNDTAVAIKRCKEVDESQKMDFVQELVILCRVNHPNIVKLLGCCLQFEAPMLVYEFVKNKTLQELLEHQRSRRCLVTLGTRLRIAAESADALAHLHSLPHPILHGDVKPANILLAEGWVAKVSDFGCSTIDEKTQPVPKGTLGYLDPDYLIDYQLTAKNDVYSFGVILLELLTSRRPLSKERKSLTFMFQEAMVDGTLHDLLDSDIIVFEGSIRVIHQTTMLASQCLAFPGSMRPTMRQVADELWRLALSEEVQQYPQPPLVLDGLILLETGNTTYPRGTLQSKTSNVCSIEDDAILSAEFAR